MTRESPECSTWRLIAIVWTRPESCPDSNIVCATRPRPRPRPGPRDRSVRGSRVRPGRGNGGVAFGVVSRWLRASEAQVRTQGILRGVYAGQNDTQMSFSVSSFLFPLSVSFHRCCTLTRISSPLVAAVPQRHTDFPLWNNINNIQRK
jgi:hypothetical protein